MVTLGFFINTSPVSLFFFYKIKFLKVLIFITIIFDHKSNFTQLYIKLKLKCYEIIRLSQVFVVKRKKTTPWHWFIHSPSNFSVSFHPFVFSPNTWQHLISRELGISAFIIIISIVIHRGQYPLTFDNFFNRAQSQLLMNKIVIFLKILPLLLLVVIVVTV